MKDKLKQLRTDKGLTQEELADKLDITRRQYIKYEMGELMPPHPKMRQLNKIFKVNLYEILLKKKRTKK